MRDFLAFCESLDLIIDRTPALGKITPVGTVHKPKSANGRVFVNRDKNGRFYGWAQNWEKSDKPSFYKNDVEFTEEEKELYKKEMRARRRIAMQEQIDNINDAKEWFDSLPVLTGMHPYLEKKGLSLLGCKGLKKFDDKLVIPILGETGFTSYQTIDANGEKRFAKGCPMKYSHFFIGRRQSAVVAFCEGFATGLAIFQAINNASVVVCFSASKLEEVASLYAGKRKGDIKNKMVVVCGDNDHETEKKIGTNPGIKSAQKAAEVLGCGYSVPTGIEGTDWADALFELKSAFRVKNEIMKGAMRFNA